MNWVTTENNKSIMLNNIPKINIAELRSEIIEKVNKDKNRVIGFFGVNEIDGISLYVFLADDINSKLLISSSLFKKGEKSYQSITTEVPAFHIFEREFYEDFGIEPIGHQWLKPVRYGYNRADKTQVIENYPFFTMEDEGIHEVAVGPIHAGVIEPGHFRFMCSGETVHHLEIQLGYQHRGIEDLFLEGNPRMKHCLAEMIAGDSSIAHTNAYANVIESLGGVEASLKTNTIRTIALELERAGIHIGDLGAIANDIAYLLGNSVYGATRTLIINTMLAICGSRFGRGLIKAGGVSYDIEGELKEKIIKTIDKVYKDVVLMSETMFNAPSVMSRLEKTGVVTTEQARQIGMVGLAARASGLLIDSRIDHPHNIYKYIPLEKRTLETGDAFSRAYLRYTEIKDSLLLVKNILENFPLFLEDVNKPLKIEKIAENSLAISIIEGWRGEVVHIAITDSNGKLKRYKIKDPSFNNWYGLALAVRRNGISDFPLCNKSFNLSYCGNDL